MHGKSQFSATGIANFLACHHLLRLGQAEAAGKIKKPFFYDPGVVLLRELGNRHEAEYLRGLRDSGKRIVEISKNVSWAEAVAKTTEAIRAGADVVYQATFQDGPWIGRADFLVRVEKPGSLGDFSYEVVETKLARSTKARAILQLCFYSELLTKIQGVQPEWMHVVLGGNIKPEKFLVSCYIAFFRKAKRDFEEAAKASADTYPDPVEHCSVCDWAPLCDQRRHDDDHLSLVAGITRIQRKELVSREVNTVARLGQLKLPMSPKIERIGDTALKRIQDQARIQVQGRDEGHMVYELLQPIEKGKGLAALPPPSPGDIFLDFESVPFVFDSGLEYLFGTVLVSEQAGKQATYQCQWAFEPRAEKKALEQFIAFVMDRKKQYPDLHIYHYAPYEPTAIKRMVGRHGVCVEEADQLLRAGVFVDLWRIVRQALRASVESYSIKQLEPLYGFTRTADLHDSIVARQTLETILTLADREEASKEVLETIKEYNRDDCFSALRLRDWLEERRHELISKGVTIDRPEPKSGEASEALADVLDRTKQIMAKLLDGLPSDRTEWDSEQYGRWLLAQLLEWHRREEKSSWWEYFRLRDLSDAELVEDRDALGGLAYVGIVGQEKKSFIHRYTFPAQEHSIDRANAVHDPRTGQSAGTVVAIDDLNRTIDVKRGIHSDVPHPTALIPQNLIGSGVLRDSLLRLGSWVAENGLDAAGPFRAQRHLLLRRTPRALTTELESVIDDTGQLTAAAKDLVFRLTQEPSILPVQGPPGSGKTFTGARMVVELVKQRRRVGITAVSHKVITNLLQEVCAVARANGIDLKAVQKVNGEDGCDDPMVEPLEDNAAVLEALGKSKASVAAGTAWLWSREDMADSVDILFIDEGGQMSLANVLAVAQAATSSVLLGDPQQLDQPEKGVHPAGAEGSAFDHLLQGRSTIGSSQGLFIAETFRLHPDVCAFTSELFYESRLQPRPENSRQRLNAGGLLDGTGLRFVPVEHSGNRNESKEEVEKISDLVTSLLSTNSTWTNKHGETCALTLEHILIVTPYNAQVAALREKLPSGARVGTVDKFQGQEAPIVFYSMTTSTPEDAPRGMEFLYSLNRLNVAVSRARCVAVIVASPALFQVECKTPRQIELANAFCRYLEMARRM
jgi:predicted RecB family nuclease